jgi:hypothetical protein
LLACCVRLLFCSVTCCFVCAHPWGVLCNLLIAFYKSRGNSFQKKLIFFSPTAVLPTSCTHNPSISS